MSGVLGEDSVYVADQKEGSRLYNKGNYGYPRSGGSLEMDLIEALYLLESGRLEIERDGKSVGFEELFRHSSSAVDGFDIKYLVYRDLRSRGFIVKTESGRFDMAVYPRGMTLSNSRPEFLVRAVSERSSLDISDFSGELSQTEKKGKELLYGVADEEGDVTYYRMSARDPRGTIHADTEGKKTSGVLISDRVFVFDEEGRKTLKETGFFGKEVGNSTQLSLMESCYLAERGVLKVTDSDGKNVSTSTLKKSGSESQGDFNLRLSVYYDLRGRGMVVKTGFKYGTHFRVYEGSPDDGHARYLAHAVSASDVTMWPEISRTVRLSGGVRKNILFCRVSDSVEYLEFKWFRP